MTARTKFNPQFPARLFAASLFMLGVMLAACSWCAAQERSLWQNPGEIESINFSHAAGREGPPRPPFHFEKEDLKGTWPKVMIRDSAGVRWRVKGGPEVKAESFATRLVSAVGYHVEPTWFIAQGKILGVRSLTRARRLIRPNGLFINASFERRDPDVKASPQDWAWNKNPFVGTNELNGLKILVMLLADWDNKDVRDQRLGSNTGIYSNDADGRQFYEVKDWGQALGGWGPRMKPRTWDCQRYTAQTKTFLSGPQGNHLRIGFTGQHTADFKNDITVENVRWLMQYLGRVTDAQIQSGLKASGATPAETACFARQIRERIGQLSVVAGS